MLSLLQKLSLRRVLKCVGGHLCKSAPVVLPPVYLVPDKQRDKYRLEITVKSTIAAAAPEHDLIEDDGGDDDDDEPIRLIFNPGGSHVGSKREECFIELRLLNNVYKISYHEDI